MAAGPTVGTPATNLGPAGGVGLFSRRVEAPMSEEQRQLQLEYEALKKEFAWLLETEYHLKLNSMDKCMEECAKKFSIVLNPSLASGGGDVRPILLSSQQQGDPVFCIASFDGDKIAKAEITLKLPNRRLLRTAIKEHTAWKLRQIQDSANFFQKAQEMYEAIKTSKDRLTSPEEIRRVFVNFATSLRKAEEVLVLPTLPNVQEIYTAEQRSHLKPELPEDMALHFHINSSLLVLTVLTIGHTNQKTGKNDFDEVDSAYWVGSTFDNGALTYEVSSQIQVESQVPWLANVLRLLQETLEMAQDLIDKVKAFESLALPKPHTS